MKNFISSLKIRHQFIFLYVTAFLLPTALISMISVAWLYVTLGKWEFMQSENSFAQMRRLFNSALEDISTVSDRIYVNRKIHEILQTEFLSPMQAYNTYSEIAFLDEMLRANRTLFKCRLYTENPTIYNNSFFIRTTDALKDADWYRAAESNGGQPLWVYKRDSVTNTEHLSLVRAVLNPADRSVLGVLSVSMNSAVLNRETDGQPFGAAIEYGGDIIFRSQKLDFSRRQLLEIIARESAGIAADEVRKCGRLEFGGKGYEGLVGRIPGFGGETFTLFFLIPTERTEVSAGHVTKIMTAVLAAFMLLSLTITLIFIFHIHGRVAKVKAEITGIVQNNFEIDKSIGGRDEFAEIHAALYKTAANIKTLIKEMYLSNLEQERLLSRQNDIRFKMLAAQINPHFLFNTLEHIRMKALDSSPGCSEDVPYMLKLLAKILRYNLSVSEKCVPLFMEIEAVNCYLEIQSRRFANRICYDIMMTCDPNEILILPLLIQPLIENCFTHAFENKLSGGFIYLMIRQEKDGGGRPRLVISVKDNGKGISAEKLRELNGRLKNPSVENLKSSLGLVNIHQRIKIFYGESYGMTIKSEEGAGTEITLVLPLVTESADARTQ